MVLEKKKISHGCHDMVVRAEMLNASSLVNSISPRVFFCFFWRSIHSFYLELRKRQALLPEETSSAHRCIRRPPRGEMGSGSLPTRPSPSAFSPPLPIPGRARPPRLRSLATGVCVLLSLPPSLCFTAPFQTLSNHRNTTNWIPL